MNHRSDESLGAESSTVSMLAHLQDAVPLRVPYMVVFLVNQQVLHVLYSGQMKCDLPVFTTHHIT